MQSNTIHIRKTFNGAPVKAFRFETRDDMNTALNAMITMVESLGYDVRQCDEYKSMRSLPSPIFVWDVATIDQHTILHVSLGS